MAYKKHTIKDRVAVGDDIFILTPLGGDKVRLTAAPTNVSEPGTDIDKSLLDDFDNGIYNAELKHKALTAALPVSGWADKEQTVAVSGVTASNTVLVSPVPASQKDYIKYGVSCTAQAAGKLTFSCELVPAVALSVSVVILGG